MADVTFFGTETGICTGGVDFGCGHLIAVHGLASDGCSYIGSSGWCECTVIPDRRGAALLLEETVSQGTSVVSPRPCLVHEECDGEPCSLIP